VCGAVLGFLTLLPWLWARAASDKEGRGHFSTLQMTDVWGHENKFTVLVDESGEVKPLLWQWPLAWSLFRGQLNVIGPQAQDEASIVTPRSASDALEFWRTVPKAPGLTGSWGAASDLSPPAAFWAQWNQFWLRPGGFSEN